MSPGTRYTARKEDVRIPALAELPMMSVVQPAYHCEPKGGHGSFLPSASRRFSCVLVLATVTSSSRITRQPFSSIIYVGMRATSSTATRSTKLESSGSREGDGGLRRIRISWDTAYTLQDM